jgi:regulator of sirC expression with transglutaminase-like and TPR domain
LVKTAIQFHHILKLLDDDSPVIQKMVRDFLLDHSLDIVLYGFLQKQEANDHQHVLLDDILSEIRFDLVKKAYLQLISYQLEDIALEQAVLILAYWNNPRVNIEQVSRQIDQLAEDIRFKLPQSGHPLVFVDHLSYYLFKKFGFRGNSEDYYHPDNSFLDKVLENRKGIPISLSILTMLVAARLNIPVSGIPMPAHFIVKFEDESDGIFFDPYFNGKIYSREECVAYLEQTRKTPVDEILAGCSNYDIILRMMRNIHLVYTSYRDEPAKASEILQLIELMEGNFYE